MYPNHDKDISKHMCRIIYYSIVSNEYDTE